MPRLTTRLPKLCLHKGTGQAVVYIDGKARYLGPHGTPQSRARYREVVAAWIEQKPDAAPRPKPPGGPTVAELLTAYRRHAEDYYRTREFQNLGDALRPIRSLFGQLLAADFGPSHLRRAREAMLEAKLSRSTINARVNRIRRFFRWCVEHEHVQPDVLARLQAVAPLKRGRGGREPEKIRPVSWDHVEATLPHLPEMVRAMVLFGWHTGARPGEIVNLTTGSIDRSAPVWVARLVEHKNAYRGQDRELLIGPKAQEILAPWLLPDQPDAPIFSPRRVDARQSRRKGKRLPGSSYSRSAFRQVVTRACQRAHVPSWTPNQLRHAAATRLREEFGIEAAQVALGHARPDTTLIYSERARSRALEAIRAAG